MSTFLGGRDSPTGAQRPSDRAQPGRLLRPDARSRGPGVARSQSPRLETASLPAARGAPERPPHPFLGRFYVGAAPAIDLEHKFCPSRASKSRGPKPGTQRGFVCEYGRQNFKIGIHSWRRSTGNFGYTVGGYHIGIGTQRSRVRFLAGVGRKGWMSRISVAESPRVGPDCRCPTAPVKYTVPPSSAGSSPINSSAELRETFFAILNAVSLRAYGKHGRGGRGATVVVPGAAHSAFKARALPH